MPSAVHRPQNNGNQQNNPILMPTQCHTQADNEASEALASYFCRMADTISVPRSVALIYHILYLSKEPMSFAEVVQRSGCSKASASTGLKLLERIRGVEVVILPDDRRTFYRAELSLRRLVAGFIHENFLSGVEAGQRILDSPTSLPESELSPLLAERLESLRNWHQFLREAIPTAVLAESSRR
jgi:DNA-binding transcriptional regulator GbsR (MarR family)